VAFFSEVVQVFGVPKSVVQIYGLLYATPDPLSFSDIVERLDISKGSASQGLQFLRSLGAVNVAEVNQEAIGAERKADSKDQQPDVSSISNNAGHSHACFQKHSGAVAPRRVAYEPELSLRRLMAGLLRERLDPLMMGRKARMQCLRAAAEDAVSGAQREFQFARLEQLGTWQRQATLIMPVFNTLLAVQPRKNSKKLA
jgi:DNA-binding transcriptional ArsR family regulator